VVAGVDAKLGESLVDVVQREECMDDGLEESSVDDIIQSLPADSRAQIQYKIDELHELLRTKGLQTRILYIGDRSRLKKTIVPDSQTLLSEELTQSEVYYSMCTYLFVTVLPLVRIVHK